MEFEKLQEIIADVLNVDPNEVTMETTFTDDHQLTNLKYLHSVFPLYMAGHSLFSPERRTLI